MNRRRPGWDPRLSTPGRSRLNTDDWYNRLYKLTAEEYSDQVYQSELLKKMSYANTAFGNFMDYVNSDTPEFALTFMSVKMPEEVSEIPDIVISPEDKDDHSLEDKRRMLKEKKWLSGLKGEEFTAKDKNELDELDVWHKIIYSDGYDFLNATNPSARSKTPLELAMELARERLQNLGGAPKGYWERTAKKIGGAYKNIVTGLIEGLPAGPLAAIGSSAVELFFGKDVLDDLPKEERTNLIDDISTSFVRKVNEIQVGTSKGKIQRTQEMLLLGQNGLEELLETIKYRDDLKDSINKLELKKQQLGLTEDEIGLLEKAKKQYNDSYIQELHASDKLDALASYDPFLALGPISIAWQKINRALDVDYVPDNLLGKYLNRVDFAYDLGLRDDLSYLKNHLRAFRKARLDGNLQEQNARLDKIKEILNTFNKNAESRKAGWTEDILYDQKDLERIDNNYKVSEYYNLQDLLAQDLGIFAPKKLLFSSAGLLGSSMSSTPKQLLKLGSYALAIAGSGPGAIAGAAAINLTAGGALATDENNAEVGLTYQTSDFINHLRLDGLLDKVLQEGREKLKSPSANIDDVIDAFAEGKIMFSDKDIRNSILNLISGANTQWAYDMNATAPGVWLDAALTVVPDAYYLRASRFMKSIAPKAIRNKFKMFNELWRESNVGTFAVRNGIRGIPEEELLAIEQVASKKGILDPLIVTTKQYASKLGNRIAESSAVLTLEKPFKTEAAHWVGQKLATAVKLGTWIPNRLLVLPGKKLLTGAAGIPVKRAAKSFAIRSIVGSGEEFWEEDVLSIREHERRKGAYGNEFIYGTYNPRLIWNNIADGVRSSLDFIFKDPSLATQEEREIWREAKLGALGWFLQGGAPAFVRTVKGTWEQRSVNDMVWQLLLNTKAENDAQIERGIYFARRALDPQDYARMMQAFDDAIEYNKKVNAENQDNGFDEEAIEENRKLYLQIYAAYYNPAVRRAITDAGFKEGSEKFNIALSLIARQFELANEDQEKVANAADLIAKYKTALKGDWFFNEWMNAKNIEFTQPVRPEPVERPQGHLGKRKQKELEEKEQENLENAIKLNNEDRASWLLAQRALYEKHIDDIFYLASAGSLIEQINTYSLLEQLSNRKSDFLKKLKDQLKKLNKERSDAGYKIFETPDDVEQLVQDRELYETAKDLYRAYDGFTQDRFVSQGIRDDMLGGQRRLSEGENVETVYSLNKIVDLYLANKESDRQLYQALEDDFFNTVQRNADIEEYIENANIGNNNNIYLGYDGKTYIVLPKVGKNGNVYYAKYEYDEDEHDAIGSELPFDKEEYYISKMADLRDLQRESSAEISDEERVKLGRRRLRRERRQQDYADRKAASFDYNPPVELQEESAQEYANRILSEQNAKERALREALFAAAEERSLILLDENPEWSYSEGESTEDQLSPQMLAYDRAVEERKRLELKAINEEARRQPQGRIYDLYRDGYRFYEKKTKRGKRIIYYAKKKGFPTVQISEEEYKEGFDYQIRQDRESNLLKTNGPVIIDTPQNIANRAAVRDLASRLNMNPNRVGLVGRENAWQELEAIILNSIYSGDEETFNDLLDYFGEVLTDENIDLLRYKWLLINDYLAEERSSLASKADMRKANEEYWKRVSQLMQQIRDIISPTTFAIFKMRDVFASIDQAQIEKWVDDFAQKKNPKTKGLIKNNLLKRDKGVNKATELVAAVKAKWHIYTKGNNIYAQAPTGEEYKLSQFQYEFYEYIKQSLQPKQLEFDFGGQEHPDPIDGFIAFINAIGLVDKLSPSFIDEKLPQTVVRSGYFGAFFDPIMMTAAINKLQGKNETGNFGTREMTEALKEVVEKIKSLDIYANPSFLPQYTTPYDYFIIDSDGNIQPYDRVHWAMEQTNNNGEWELPFDINHPLYKSYNGIIDRLEAKLQEAVGKLDKSIFVREILKIENEYNNAVHTLFLNLPQSDYEEAVKANTINLQGWIKYAEQEKTEHALKLRTIKGVAHIAATDKNFSKKAKYWTTAGTYIDDILRTIFMGKVPVNYPKYKMSDSTFNKLIKSIYGKKHALDALGIKVITDPILLTGFIENTYYGYDVAGSPDMLAVDRDGNVYLIDFKTTSGLFKYDNEGNKISTKRYTPQEAHKENKSNTDTHIEFDNELLISYRNQLTMYARLIQQNLGVFPKKLFIAPIYLERVPAEYIDSDAGKFITEDGVLGEIKQAIPFQYFEIQPNMDVIDYEEEEFDWTSIDELVVLLNDKIGVIRESITKNVPSGQLLAQWTNITNAFDTLLNGIAKAKEENLTAWDTINSDIDEIEQNILKFRDEYLEYLKKSTLPPTPPSPQPLPKRGHIFNPQLRLATGELEMLYNNIDYRHLPSLWNAAKKEAFKRVTALPDFILNSVWELNVKSYLRINSSIRIGDRANRPNINLSITYDEHLLNGQVVHHVFDNLMILVKTLLDDGNVIVNQRLLNPLLLKIDSFLFDFDKDGNGTWKPNAEKIRIIFTKKSRTNGIPLHDPDLSKMRPATEVFAIDDDKIESLLEGNDIGIVGVTSRGSLGKIKPTSLENRDIIRGIPEDRSMRDGLVAISIKMPYLEDETERLNSPIIPFTAKFFTEEDSIFLVNLLANYGKYLNLSMLITVNGQKYDSPISAHDLLYNILIRFHAGKETGNEFILDFVEENGKTNFHLVQATEWGTGKPLPRPFDLRTKEGKNGLYSHLKAGASVWYLNERLMTMGTTQKLDSRKNNFFLAVEQFFKDHPDINLIKYTDSLVFDRADFDPDGDGSFRGISGFLWMMRHGWMLSTFTGNIIWPLLSTDDVEMLDKPEDTSDVDEAPLIHTESRLDSIVPEGDVDRSQDPFGFSKEDVALAMLDMSASAEAGNMYDFLVQMQEKGPDKIQRGRAISPIDVQIAEKRIKRILGKKFPVRFIPTFVEMFANGDNSVGRLTKRGIILSQYAENGTEFHEAFHGVVEVLLPESARKRLYDHYIDHYANGKKLKDRAVAEGLADLYYDFKTNTPEVKLTWNILKVFKNLYDYARALANLDDIKIALMFAATDAGMMRLFSVKPGRLADIERRFGHGLDMTVKDINGKDHNLSQFGNFRTINDFVDVLTYKLIHNAGIDVLGKNMWQLDTRLGAIKTTLLATPEERATMLQKYEELSKVKGVSAWDEIEHSKEYKQLTMEGITDDTIDSAIKAGYISPLTARNARLFREAFAHWDLFRPMIESRIASFGVDKKVERERIAVENQDGGEGHNLEEFGHYEQPFYEHSLRDDVPTKIRYFLSTRPNRKFADVDDVLAGRVASIYRINDQGEKERLFLDVRNNSLGYATYIPYNKVYNTLLRLCHGARNIEELDTLLNQLGKTDYLMYNIGKAYHMFRTRMYKRWSKNEFDEYDKKVKVMVRTSNGRNVVNRKGMQLLHPSEYNASEFPNVVVYSHDIVSNTGELLHKQGDIITDAVILTDPDYEQLVTQLFQAIHAQRLNFQHIYSVAEIDKRGKPTGRYTYDPQSTSLNYDTKLYPRQWFAAMRSGFGGIFVTEDDSIKVAVKEDGSSISIFRDVAIRLRNFSTAISSQSGKLNVHRIPVGNTYKDLYNDDDFAEIEIEFAKMLNQVGVPLDVSTLNYMLLVKYPRTDIREAFRNIFTSTGVDSIAPFIEKDGVLESLQKSLDSKDFDVFFNDKPSVKNEQDPTKNVPASGFLIYGESGFLTDLAIWVGQYRLANRDAMQIGPNNTKLYTYAQHHSASEAVDEINNTYSEGGVLNQNGLIQDMIESPYVRSADGSRSSIIARDALDPNFNPTHDRVKLATFEGVRLNTAQNGGTKYSEISSREDWLSKASLLQRGHIIFPTLSDKSTWFYLLGFVLPGINYDASINKLYLPKISNSSYSRLFFDRNQFDSKQAQQYYNSPDPVIDLLIDYAYLELDLVNQTINQLGILDVNSTNHHLETNEKVSNFHTGTINGARFAFLTGVYGRYVPIKDQGGNEVDFVIDERYDEFIDFNYYDSKDPEGSVLRSREKVMRIFFDKKVNETDAQLKARQRSMIANMLQHRVKDQLNDLVEKGIIKRADPYTAKTYKDNKGVSRYDSKISDFFGYLNIYLDFKAIDMLKDAYRAMPIGSKTYASVYSEQLIESAAIVAYVYDITAKSIMSKEETLRIFTGFPHFFKWKFDKNTGKLINIIEDESKRHGGEGSTGTSNITDLPNIDRTYRAAEIKDYLISSPILRDLKRVFTDNEYRDALVDILAEEEAEKLQNRKPIEGENIYSKGSDFAKLLTNLGNDVDILFRGKHYKNAEHAYLVWKSGIFDQDAYEEFSKYPHGSFGKVDTDSNFSLMVEIITAKLQQHPELISGISERGGEVYLSRSRHIVPGLDRYWQTGHGNRFMAALFIAYKSVINGGITDNITDSDAEIALNEMIDVIKREESPRGSFDKIMDEVYDRAYSMTSEEVIDKVLSYKNGSYKTIVDAKIEAAINAFGNNDIDVADGTAYVSDKMAENLLRMRGAWNSDIQTAFEYLRGNILTKPAKSGLTQIKAYKLVMDALIGAQKYSAFGYRMQHGVPVHYYNKYALFPVFKGISYGFTSELYKKMNDPEYGVDMVMFQSSVKVGQLGGLLFVPEMTLEDLQKFSFKDHIYELNYSMLRRQLNTDPHEREEMPIGTQAAKVALSIIEDNQNYTLSNGDVVRGRDIKTRIMNAIKALSGIGVDKVHERFYTDGKPDNVKFANFLENELLNRNADKNILDAVRQLKTDNSPILNSVTNMAWVESILISFINKNVIDINVPGTAFYQRSVFGMEGIVGDDTFPVLAGGKPLQMINEEGSMDAVVSLDFFYNILPKHLRYNFDKAKQWLIDNYIISGVLSKTGEWHNANANIMAYRIPTQAASSIHALRIVDVLPILRDTIVLPKEFTRITGSDFDIDKLYCSMLKYNTKKITYNDTVVFGEKKEIEWDANTYFDKEVNPEEYYLNELMRLYLDLLKDTGKKITSEGDGTISPGKYAHILHRPVDNDTDLIHQVLDKIEANVEKSVVEPFVAGSLYTLSNLKSSLAVAKFGIGPFALNNNSHILTRLYHVSFKDVPGSIMNLLDATSLYKDKDRDGNPISSWISAFINAHVDVAKDPYILRLNVNKYTYNLISLLTRTGFGKDTLYFVALPILKHLAEEYQNSNGDIVDDPSLSPTDRWKKREREAATEIDFGNDRIRNKINKIFGVGNVYYSSSDFEEDSDVFKALFGMESGNYVVGSSTLLEKLLTDTSYRIDPNKPASIKNLKTDTNIKIGTGLYSARELLGYVFLAKKLFDEYADALGNLVQLTKIDTKKHGISYLEQRLYMQRYNLLKDYENNLFDSNLLAMLEDSFIDYKTTKAIPMLKEILLPHMINFTDLFLDIVDKMQIAINNKSNDARKAILGSIMSYIKQKAMNRVMELQLIDFLLIITGKNSLANRIEILKNKILSGNNPEYSFYASNGVITNSILANIHPVPYITEYGLLHYHFLQLDNSADDDVDVENDYIDSFEQMWNSPDEEIKAVARDLAIYAFMTSGDNRGFGKFFKYVPLKLRLDIGYVDNMNMMYHMFASGQMQLFTEGNSMNTININELYKNSWRNNKIIPVFKPRKAIIGHKTLYNDQNRQNGQIIKRDTYDIFMTSEIGINSNTGTYNPYIKMRRPGASIKDADPYLLYKLVGIGKIGRDELPVYALTESKGVSVRTGADVYELYEYDREDQNGHITDGNRMDDVDWSGMIDKLVDEISGYIRQYPTYTEERIAQGTIDKHYNKNPKTGEPMVDTTINEGEDGKQSFTQQPAVGYRSVIRAMYNKETSIRKTDLRMSEASGHKIKSLRFSDQFRKFCKGI